MRSPFITIALLLATSIIMGAPRIAKILAADSFLAVTTDAEDDAKVKKNLAKLSDADRKIAEEQRICPIEDEPLGSVGVPIKLTIKGKPVFICCKSCKEAAEKDPEKTLAKVEELKKKKK